MTLQELEIEISALIHEHNEIIKRTNVKLKDIQLQISCAKAKRQQILNGLDSEIIAAARKVLDIRGEYSPQADKWHKLGADGRAVDKAVEDLSRGAPKMKDQYFGVKIYSGFGRQGEDHMYGNSPRHGSIVFSIGLHPGCRNRELLPEEINAVLYFLLNIKRITDSDKEAKGDTA